MPTPDPLPTGPITTPLAVLAEMIAACQAFQERSGLTFPDPEAVEKLVYGERGVKRVWYPSLESEEFPEFLPFAVVSPTAAWKLARKAGGGRNYHSAPEATLSLFVGIEARFEKAIEASFRDFTNYLGELARDLEEQSGTGGKLSFNEIRTASELYRSTEADEASLGRAHWFCMLEVDYGI